MEFHISSWFFLFKCQTKATACSINACRSRGHRAGRRSRECQTFNAKKIITLIKVWMDVLCIYEIIWTYVYDSIWFDTYSCIKMYKVLYNIPKPMLRCFKLESHITGIFLALHRSPERLPRLPAEECEPCGARDPEAMDGSDGLLMTSVVLTGFHLK
jgi:hypothetical protein